MFTSLYLFKFGKLQKNILGYFPLPGTEGFYSQQEAATERVNDTVIPGKFKP